MTDTPKSILEQISTYWPLISNPLQFVMRYAPAIRKYVSAIVKQRADADDVTQEFLTRVFEKGFCPTNVSRGRFRDYLKAAVRYVSLSVLRQRRLVELDDAMLESLITKPDDDADSQWDTQWRECLLDRAWQLLELHQHETVGNLFFTTLRMTVDFPDEDSEALAARVSMKLGKPYRADAFRQQLRRARKEFARLIVAEIKNTLHDPQPADIEHELLSLGLMPYVRDYLTAESWRQDGEVRPSQRRS